MKINMIKVPVSELIQGYYEDDATGKVTAWGGKLDVRPEYQREYVYGEGQRDAVINTVLQGFPLNIMYFVDRKDGTYEVLDGQQRIISICRYAQNKYSVKVPVASGGYDSVNYPNLFESDPDNPDPWTRQAFEKYELMVYICEGTEKEKIDWFKIINIAGEELENQEILNAVLHSPWVTDCKSVFSRRNCPAYKHYGKYMAGDCIRQKYLETVYRWCADAEGIRGRDAVSQYMMKHRYDSNANALWDYFEKVFKWVQETFGKFNANMKGVEWGLLYNRHKDDNLDPNILQMEVEQLMADDEVGSKKGIYEYLLSTRKPSDERLLSLRAFSENEKKTMYARQNGVCPICGKKFELKEMDGDHKKPWSKGGKTTLENGQMLCRSCNLKKSAG